jgi:iron(III) transport system permease protein
MATIAFPRPRPSEVERPWARWLDPGRLIPLGAALILVYLTIVPLAMLVVGSLSVEGQPGLTLANYAEAYSRGRTYRLLANSFVYAIGSALLAFALGTSLAWIVERTNTPFRQWFYGLSLVPIIIPGVLGTIAWIFLLSPKIGWVNTSLKALFGLEEAPFNVFSMGGMIWVEGLHLSPLVFLTMAAAFKSMDPALEESAMMSGAGTGATLRRVTLKLLLPAAASGMLIMFVRGLESFEVPALIGIPARTPVFTSEIYLALHKFPPDFGLAGALAIGLMAISGAGVLLYHRLTSRGDAYSTVTGKAFRPRVLDLGRWRYVTAAFLIVYFLVIVGLPFFILLWSSLLPFYQTPSLAALSFVTWENYQFVFTYPRAQLAARNSLLLAIGAATGVSLLTAIIAWITVKTRLPGRAALDLLAFLPIGIPGLVLGVSMIWLYLTFPLPIYGTIWILIIAYITKYLPYGMRTNSGAMVQIHRELEEAGQMSGASWWTTFRRVTLPLLRPGLMAGWIYIFVVSVRELSTSVLLATSQSTVLSLLIFDLFESGKQTAVAAVGVMMITGLVVVVGIVNKISGQFGIRA